MMYDSIQLVVLRWKLSEYVWMFWIFDMFEICENGPF
jgi:hypothetical protein